MAKTKDSKAKSSGVVKKTGVKPQKKHFRNVSSGIVHVKATFNNTVISITDLSGHVIAWSSAGRVKFSGSRKSSAFAASVAAQEVGKSAMNNGMKEVEVYLKGPGAGRESAVRGLQSIGLVITLIKDHTPIPHNGCRSRKRRRV